MNIIDKSINILADRNLDEIWRAGIRRDPVNYHITVMYPPLKVMDKMESKEIFSNFHNKSREFSLYVHIPFCSGKCSFCYFHQIEKPGNGIIADYLAALKKEIEIVAHKISGGLGSVKIKSVFFGGGSPTVLTEDQFKDLIHFIKQNFQLSEKTEITVEVHPEIIRKNGRSLLQTYFKNNVNRLNIGVQSFDNHILKITNRRHTAKEAVETFELARSEGFNNVNIDLLYPLPDLTSATWAKTLDTAFGLDPESVTTYFTAFRKPSPIYNFYQKSPNRFPNEQMNHLFRIMTMKKAKQEGYNSDELIDWFVKPREGFHYEHQKNEARRSEEVQLLSFGSGVFSYFNYHQYYNYPDIRRYCASLKKNELPIWKGIKLSKEERLARAMVLGIKSGEVNIKRVENAFQEDVGKKYNSLLKNLQRLGLLEKLNGSIKLSEKGVLFADEVAIQFISQDVKRKLNEKQYLFDPEIEMINTYNFMYDTEGVSFL